MGKAFWIRRFLSVLAGALIVIATAQVMKGHPLGYAFTQGLIWGTISAAIFTSARIHQSRRGLHCAICRDTPEMLAPDGNARS